MEKPFKKLQTPFRCYSCVPSLKISLRPQGVGFVTNCFKLRQIYSPGGLRHMCEARCTVYCSPRYEITKLKMDFYCLVQGSYCLLNRTTYKLRWSFANSICNCVFERGSIVTQTSGKGSEISFFPRDSNLVQLQFVFQPRN